MSVCVCAWQRACAVLLTLHSFIDVPNLFHEALAVVLGKEYLYSRRKLSANSNECYHFQLAIQCMRKLRSFNFFFYTKFQ